MIFQHKIRAFYRFFLSYILILVIPLVISCFVYREVLRIVELDEKESSLVLLEKVKDTFDDRLTEIEQMVSILSNDRYVRQFAGLERLDDGLAFFDLYNLVRHLTPYQDRNQLVHSFYIYFRNSNRLIMANSSYDIQSFYDSYYSYGDMNYVQWKEVFLDNAHKKDLFPVAAVTIGPANFYMLTYIESFPRISRVSPTFVIWIFIDEKELKRLLSDISSEGWVYIVDKSGRNMVSTLKTGYIPRIDALHFDRDKGFLDCEIEGDRMIVSYTTSSRDGLKFISAEPYRTVMSKTYFLRWLMIGISLAMMCLGLLTAYMLARGSTKPLKELVKVFRERKRTDSQKLGNEYDFIKKNVSELFDRNESLKKEMDEQLPLHRAAFFGRLLKGEHTTDSEIQDALSHLEIDMTGASISVVHTRINLFDPHLLNGRLRDLSRAKAALKAIINRDFSERLYVYDKAEDELVLLFRFKSFETGIYQDIIEKTLQKIYDEMVREFKTSVSFAAGTLYPHLTKVWLSFRESVETSEGMRIRNDFRISWYEERNQSNSTSYYYPLDLEERLLNNVKGANREEVEDVLALIYRENIENRRLSPDMLQFLINDMYYSAVKVVNQIKFRQHEDKEIIIEKVNALKHHKSFNDAFEDLKGILQFICSSIDERKRSHKRELILRIKEYIQDHHDDFGLNRYQVANHFGMTEEYFSVFFKEQAGVSFSDFLEKARLEEASGLLCGTDLPINEIASNVGYGSSRSFSRAFRRANGINPTAYRDITENQQV